MTQNNSKQRKLFIDNLNHNKWEQSKLKRKTNMRGGAEEAATGVGEAASVVEAEEAAVGCLPGGLGGGRCQGQHGGGVDTEKLRPGRCRSVEFDDGGGQRLTSTKQGRCLAWSRRLSTSGWVSE